MQTDAIKIPQTKGYEISCFTTIKIIIEMHTYNVMCMVLLTKRSLCAMECRP